MSGTTKIKDYVEDLVASHIQNLPNLVKGWVGEEMHLRNPMLQEIVVEKAEMLQKLITEKANQLDQNISAYQRPLEKQLERHGERIAGMQSPLPPLQENLKATKVLEEQNKQLVSILKDLQVQTGELAKTSPTPQDIKNEI